MRKTKTTTTNSRIIRDRTLSLLTFRAGNTILLLHGLVERPTTLRQLSISAIENEARQSSDPRHLSIELHRATLLI
jgi:hypothetical protein